MGGAVLMNDDELLRAIERIVNAALETHGLKTVTDRRRSLTAERQRRFRERNASSNARVTRPRAKRNAGSNAIVTPSAATWAAYAAAYQQRYGVEPTRNAMVNGQLAQFVARVPAAEAPQIAAFYVRHNKAFYVSSRHAVGGLVKDAEGLRTQWLSGQTVTDAEARQADRTQATGNAFAPLIAEAREREKQRGTH